MEKKIMDNNAPAPQPLIDGQPPDDSDGESDNVLEVHQGLSRHLTQTQNMSLIEMIRIEIYLSQNLHIINNNKI